MKKVLSFFFVLIFVAVPICDFAGVVPTVCVLSQAASISGKCGTSLEWSFDSATEELVISGTGEMSSYSVTTSSPYSSYSKCNHPWYLYYNKIKSVVIKDGVTSIGDNAFYNCTALYNVKIPDTVKKTGENVFYNCPLVQVAMPAVSAEAGETVSVPVNFTVNPGIAAFKAVFNYDADALTPVRVEYGENLSSGLQDNIGGNAKPGELCVYWAGTGNESFTGNIFNIVFEAKNDFCGKTQIFGSFSKDDTFYENSGELKDIGLVFIPECAEININNPLYSNAPSANLSCNDNVDSGDYLRVCLSMDEIGTLSSTMFDLIKSNEFTLVAASALNGADISAVDKGDYVSILVSSLSSVMNNKKVAELTFKVSNEANGNYDFGLSVSSDDIIMCSGTSVNVIYIINAFTVYSQPVCGLPGDTVTVALNLKNNTGLLGYKLYLEYDTDVFTAISVSRGALCSSGSFSENAASANGSLYIMWVGNSIIDADGEIALVQFKINGNALFNQYAVNVSYDIFETFDGNYCDVMITPESPEINVFSIKGSDINTYVDVSKGLIVTDELKLSSPKNILIFDGSGVKYSYTKAAGIYYGTGSVIKATMPSGSLNSSKTFKLVIKGDCNGDGICDVLDLTVAEKCVNGSFSVSEIENIALDCIPDDDINVMDYLYMVNTALGG